MPKEIAITVPEMLAAAGADKITFVGGEPTLCPYLGDLLAASKDVGLTTCIVSNATGLTEEFLDEWGHLIDWVGLSIDASNDELHAEIGRGMRGDLARQLAIISNLPGLGKLHTPWNSNEVEHSGLQGQS